MKFLLILATLFIGVVFGMAFTTIFYTEKAKADRAQIRALINENTQLRRQKRTAQVVEIVDRTTPKNDVKFGGF